MSVLHYELQALMGIVCFVLVWNSTFFFWSRRGCKHIQHIEHIIPIIAVMTRFICEMLHVDSSAMPFWRQLSLICCYFNAMQLKPCMSVSVSEQGTGQSDNQWMDALFAGKLVKKAGVLMPHFLLHPTWTFLRWSVLLSVQPTMMQLHHLFIYSRRSLQHENVFSLKQALLQLSFQSLYWVYGPVQLWYTVYTVALLCKSTRFGSNCRSETLNKLLLL